MCTKESTVPHRVRVAHTIKVKSLQIKILIFDIKKDCIPVVYELYEVFIPIPQRLKESIETRVNYPIYFYSREPFIIS